MRLNATLVIGGALVALTYGSGDLWAQPPVTPAPLSEVGRTLEARYAEQLQTLRAELAATIPQNGQATPDAIEKLLGDDGLDDRLVKYVVLHEATPQALARFAQQGKEQAHLVEKLLADAGLMKQMLVADGANAPREGRGLGPAAYGPAMKIYADIRQSSPKAAAGIFQRLALAVALEHAVPIAQHNPAAQIDAPATVDPVNRYRHYENAYLAGELDPGFDRLSTWELRMVVNGDEPDETLAWGRTMLRNYRPDHIYNPNTGWRYVSIVASDVKYGSGDVKFDRSELQGYQNILMNGGVCGRRAFFGRFILRAFGVPTTARPSRGHAALAHASKEGWVVCLGGGWGAGWTGTRYGNDLDFLATTQARNNPDEFLKVKRAQWIGDVRGEPRTYGEHDGTPAFWNAVALRTQRSIIDNAKTVTLGALGEDLGEANEPTIAEKVLASPVSADDRKITYGKDGVVSIPAAAYSTPSGNTQDVIAMQSFGGGMQVFLPRFFPQGQTVLRGGTWKSPAAESTSGSRLLSGGYGRYDNWGLRVAATPAGTATPRELKLDLGGGVSMELVYIKPGTFVMGGESTTDGRFQCVETPPHEVTLTRGIYLGKYEVTQAQYEAVMGSNPSTSTRSPDCPADTVSESEALEFCAKLAERTGQETRLPTEAEWEYAARAGRATKWFFGDDASELGKYAWIKDNADAKSHPVGQKKPSPWGLFDIYGNVCERISDRYSRSYYSTSPKIDPTGPSQGVQSRLEYTLTLPRSGEYRLTARVVTVNDGQRLNVSANGIGSGISMEMPFTVGEWQESEPISLTLKEGENVLRFWRDQPPQYGLAIKEFTLTPVK